MSEERCERSDLIKSQCSHCQGLDGKSGPYEKPTRILPNDRVTGFPASYEGHCDLCDNKIEIGQMICKSDHSFMYVHYDCETEE